eukprot:c46246_g1_i1.p1 GENE.c46246_g1_i1~~c46246_g1_i1.p1  ORF type:complete len:272 (+),score=68.81 c46246_g1_i1:61-876(+)
MFDSLFSKKIVNSLWIDAEMRQLETEFDDTAKLYDSILPAIKGMFQSQSTNAIKLTEFSKAMSTHGTGEKHPLSKVFEKCSEGHKALADVQLAFLQRYKTVVMDPVVEFLDKDIKQMKTKRKEFYSEIGKYDSKAAALEKLNTPEKRDKLQSAKQELAAQEEKLRVMVEDVKSKYKSLTAKKRQDLVSVMRQLGMMQMEFFDSSQRALDAPHRAIESYSADVLAEVDLNPAAHSSSQSQHPRTSLPNLGASSIDNPFLDNEDNLTPRSNEI